jgi:hypothetical protein
MLREKNSLLILITVANVVMVAGILYAAGPCITVSTLTSHLNIDDFGGNPAQCGGSAYHNFTAGSGVPYTYSYSTTVHHNGAYVDDDYDSSSGTGPTNFNEWSSAAGYTTSVAIGHNTKGSHGSYIVNDNTSSDYCQDTKSSSTYRASD